MGGFSGQVPSTPLAQFVDDVRDGRIDQVLVAVRPPTRNPDLRWVLAHCIQAPSVGSVGGRRINGRTLPPATPASRPTSDPVGTSDVEEAADGDGGADGPDQPCRR